jgi:hypothetical protein
MKPRLTPRHVRAHLTYPIDLSDGSVLLRRGDIMNLCLTGKLNVSMLRYAQILEEISTKQALGASTLVEEIENLPAEDRLGVLTMLRAYACAMIADPMYSMVDTGDPRLIPVETLSSRDLTLIWSASPPAAVEVDPDQPLVIPATAADQDSFRAPVEVRTPAVSEFVVPDDPDPLPADENLDVQTLNLDDGRVVDFARG